MQSKIPLILFLAIASFFIANTVDAADNKTENVKIIIISTSFVFYDDQFRLGTTDRLFASNFSSVKQNVLADLIYKNFEKQLHPKIRESIEIINYNSSELPSEIFTEEQTLHLLFNVGMRQILDEDNNKILIGAVYAIFNPQKTGGNVSDRKGFTSPEPFLIRENAPDSMHLNTAIQLSTDYVARTVNKDLALSPFK